MPDLNTIEIPRFKKVTQTIGRYFPRAAHPPCGLSSHHPTIVILLIMGMGSIMSVGFEKAYLMQNNLNLAHSELISTYVYKVGLSGTGAGKTDFSYSTAIGLFNSLMNLVLIVITNTISRRVSETSLW